jgi:hypothetical protein
MKIGTLVRHRKYGCLGIVLLGCHPVMSLIHWIDDGKQVYTNPSFFTVIA